MLWVPSPFDLSFPLLAVILTLIYIFSLFHSIGSFLLGLKKAPFPLYRQPAHSSPAKLLGIVISTHCFNFLPFHSLSQSAFSKITSYLPVATLKGHLSVLSLFDTWHVLLFWYFLSPGHLWYHLHAPRYLSSRDLSLELQTQTAIF